MVSGKNLNRYSNKSVDIHFLDEKVNVLKIGTKIVTKIYYHVSVCCAFIFFLLFFFVIFYIFFFSIIIVDHSRVKLKDVDSTVPGSEYINANYIRQPTENDQCDMNSSSENLAAVQQQQQPSCPSCTAAQQQKSCQNCQMLNKICVQCAMKSATLPLSTCTQCNRKTDSVKHKRNESITSRNFTTTTTTSTPKKDEKDMFKTYIATQGCLPATTADFWNMIWQENTRVIVMTTKELERGKSKCVKYWPDQGQTKEWGPAKVTCLSESSTNDYTLREFLFSWKNKEERRIYHYHFQVWPDHGVPLDPGCVLNFLHDVNARQEQIMVDGVTPVNKKKISLYLNY